MASVRLVDRTGESAPGRHALLALSAALRGRGIAFLTARVLPVAPAALIVVAGRAGDDLVRSLLAAAGAAVRTGAEVLTCAACPAGAARALVLAGSDERGLAYALREAADRVRTRGLQALEAMAGLAEAPEHSVRSVCRFVMGRLDDEWYGSPDFWRSSFDRLVSARFNRFTLIMGFDTGWLTPPYPFFVEVPEFPRVRAKGIAPAELHRRREHLRAIARMAHEYGLDFFLGTWQQSPWVREEERLVDNLPREEGALAEYCAAGLKALLRAVPELDGIHFRVNHEAGVGTRESNERFWRTLVRAAGEVRRDLKLELRAKGLSDGMIRDALATGLPLTVPTKYWCEHAGLPYHLTQMRREELTQLADFNHSRRYSYADMLRRPRSYETLYRLWNNGTTSVLLWGDPDYARRFSVSCHLGDACGFEISDPLALRWGHSALQKEAWRIHKSPAYAPGAWEDERYWMTYLLFGRLGYSAETSPEIWEREIAARFPAGAAEAVLDAYGNAGKILPLITAFHMPVHPQLQYWPEISTGAALFEENNHGDYRYMGRAVSYGTTEPSDPGLFYGVSDYVADAAAGMLRPRYTPPQVAEWLAALCADTRMAVSHAAAAAGIENAVEWPGTELDFLMLADMAEYHSRKIEAAVALAWHERLADPVRLVEARAAVVAAREAWRALAERGSAFADNLVFQAGGMTGGRMGHWRDWLPELDKDVAKLEALIREGAGAGAVRAASAGPTAPGPAARPSARAPGALASVEALVPATAAAGVDLEVRLRVDLRSSQVAEWTLFYRHTNQLEGPFRADVMEPSDDGFRALIPAEYLTPEWDLLVYFGCVVDGRAVLYPGLWNARHAMPYLVVQVR